MLQALIDGQTDVTALAQLAKGRLRSKPAELEVALRGTLEPHHPFMISQHLALLDVFDEQIAAFDGTRPALPPADGAAGAQQPAPEGTTPTAPDSAWAAQAILDAIPGIGIRVAEIVLAEPG